MRTRHTTIEGGRERAAHNRVPQAKDVPDKELIRGMGKRSDESHSVG